MCLKSTDSACNRTVSHNNSIICAQCFKTTHLICNSLNFVDSQLAAGFSFVAPIIFFLLLTLQIKNCNQSPATRKIMLMIT